MEFENEQIFEGVYPPEAAAWCNDGGTHHIEEIEAIEKDGETVRRFQIVENGPLEETDEQREERLAYTAREEWLSAAPDAMADQEAAICELYELLTGGEA